MTKVGTSNALRSCRKSVLVDAVVQSKVPFGEAAAAMATL
jgi:hypothetical protein